MSTVSEMTSNKKLGGVFSRLALLAALAAAAQASPVIWDLQGLTFSDGNSGTGYFVFDADIGKLVTWNVVTYTGPSFNGYSYTPSTSIASADSAGCSLNFVADARASQALCLNPASSLVAGATPVLLLSSNETGSSGQRFVASGVLQDPPAGGGATIPEPATVGLVAFGIIAVFRFARRLTPGSFS